VAGVGRKGSNGCFWEHMGLECVEMVFCSLGSFRKDLIMTRRTAKEWTGLSSRSGIAKNQLIFIIICSAAIGVAVVTMAIHLWSGGSGARRAASWQCLKCNAEFTKKTTEMPPIACEKCDGQAVSLNRLACPKCEEEVLISRMRMTEQGKAQHEARKAQMDGGRPPMPPGMGMMGGLPMEMQLWVRGTDGNYAWSKWTPSSVAGQYYSSLTCEKCGASLYRQGGGKSR
jgi:DNA-directed RNA polymerase subunit RPC12/RpoP